MAFQSIRWLKKLQILGPAKMEREGRTSNRSQSDKDFHRRSKSIDPTVFMNEPLFWTAFEWRKYECRNAILKCFQSAVPCEDQSITDDEYKQVFSNFIKHFFTDYRISYGYISYFSHIYLIYWTWRRSHYCPSTGNYFTICDCIRPPAMVDLSQHIQTIFYTSTFLAHMFIPKLECFLQVYGSFLVQAALCVTFWQVPYSGTWILSGGRYGTFYSVYIPWIFWWWYLICARNRMAISFWEDEQLIHSKGPHQDTIQILGMEFKNIIPLSAFKILSNYIPSNRSCRLLSKFVRKFWFYFTPIIYVWLYKTIYISGHVHVNRIVDVPPASLPGIFLQIIYCLISSGGLILWLNYLVPKVCNISHSSFRNFIGSYHKRKVLYYLLLRRMLVWDLFTKFTIINKYLLSTLIYLAECRQVF